MAFANDPLLIFTLTTFTSLQYKFNGLYMDLNKNNDTDELLKWQLKFPDRYFNKKLDNK